MKIIHCGDIHLESPMRRNLPTEKARERKNEMLLTFEKMVEYAKAQSVSAILICGDLFDGKTVTMRTRQAVKNCMLEHSDIMFYYLKGNHDDTGVLEVEELPENLRLFTDQWTTYEQEDITISGLELNADNNILAAERLMLKQSDCNLVMLHGQTSEYQSQDKVENINLSSFRNRNIDYLALGHIHSFHIERLDQRGQYGYCGCLEGRGFDECGEKGFVLLTIEDHQVTPEFIPFAGRQIYDVRVDISETMDNKDVADKIMSQIHQIARQSLVKVTLVGKVSVDAERNLEYLTKKFEDHFYAFKIKDETGTALDMESIQKDISLKGEYLRLVMEQELDEQTKRELIETGLGALTGEEILS